MKQLWKYTKGYRRQNFVAPFMKLIEALLELLVPLLVAEIIDVMVQGNRANYENIILFLHCFSPRYIIYSSISTH